MAARLSPCPSCTRHVKVGAAACPFCGGEVPTNVPARAVPAVGRPLTRAAILFAGATAVSGCSSGMSVASYGVFVSPYDAEIMAQPAYGGFANPVDGGLPLRAVDAGVDGGMDAAYDSGVVALYGDASFPVDAGTDATSDSGSDAHSDGAAHPHDAQDGSSLDAPVTLDAPH